MCSVVLYDAQHINLRYKIQDTKDCAINNQLTGLICFELPFVQSISNQSYKTLSLLGRTWVEQIAV